VKLEYYLDYSVDTVLVVVLLLVEEKIKRRSTMPLMLIDLGTMKGISSRFYS
jgi:hypothetical protein